MDHVNFIYFSPMVINEFKHNTNTQKCVVLEYTFSFNKLDNPVVFTYTIGIQFNKLKLFVIVY